MLRIKKQIKNTDGTITEVEGTEAEVESFLKKHEKMQEESGTLQDRAKRKRDLILGKDAREEVEAMIAEAIIRHLYAANHSAYPTQHIHHWYRWGEYWWQPWWDGNQITYRYTAASDPTNVGISTYTSCNSVADLSSKLGCSSGDISSQLIGTATTNGGAENSSFLETYKSILGHNKVMYDGSSNGSWADTEIKLGQAADALGALSDISSKA